MPVSSYRFKIELDSKDLVAEARRIRTELEKELGRGFDFQQAQQQMGAINDLSRTTGANAAVIAGGLGQAAQEGDRLVFDMRQADDATRQMISDLFRSGASAQQLEQALRGGKQGVQETRQEVKWLGRDLEEVAKMGRMERFGAAMTAAAQQTYGMRALAGGLGRVGTGMMTTGAAITGPAVLAGRRWLEYTRTVGYSARAMGLAREESEALRQELIRQSEALGMVSPEEMAEGLYMWTTGVGATARNYEDLQRIIQDTIPIQEMAYLQGIDMATATQFTAGIMGEFGLAVDETERVVDILDATADRTFATVSDLGEAFKMVGPIAHQLDISVEEAAATLGVLSDANIKGTMAGRALRQTLIGLTKTTKEEDKTLNTLLRRNEELGESWKDLAFRGEEFVGIAEWIDLLAVATENLTEEERAAALATIATANELPALTHLVGKQIEARQHGINIIRAEAKIMEGVIDSEAEAYARFVEETTGNIMDLTSAHEARARKVEGLTEEEGYRIDQLTRKWDAAMLHLGAAVMEMALPAVEELTRLLGEIAEFIEAHPEAIEAAVTTGAILTGIGAFVLAAGKGIRLYADVKMITAAATMYQASTNMLQAAGLQATTGATFLSGVGKLVGPLALIAAALSAEKFIVEKAGVPDWMQTQMARGTETYEAYSRAVQEITQGRMEPLTKAQWEAVHAGQELGDVLEETGDKGTIATHDIAEEMRSLKEHERNAKKEAKALGNELMQLPPATTKGLAAFTEAELEAIDELEAYLRRRNELVEEQNEELADMEADFLEEQAERYQDYLTERAKLERELQDVIQDPRWRTTKEVQESLKREQEAFEEYAKRTAEILADHQKKLRDLREDHDDKMEDLEAQRDAKGILAERRRYSRAVRDANEQKDEQLAALKDRLDETIKEEREKIETLREERRADLEEKLKELDENYQEEARKRQQAHDKEMEDKRQQHIRDLQQLDRAHAERLASIMGWEERVRQFLRQSYIGREGDLREHLARMERMYLEAYNAMSQLSPEAMTVEEYRQWHEDIRGHQAGGYAPRGIYRLGEAGREFVLSAPTTRALERAMGPLNQAKMLTMTTSSGYFRLDINVMADPVFSPEFARQTEALVQAEIVSLAKHVTQGSHPGAHRIH